MKGVNIATILITINPSQLPRSFAFTGSFVLLHTYTRHVVNQTTLLSI